jgi:hypothetical protein
VPDVQGAVGDAFHHFGDGEVREGLLAPRQHLGE